MTQSKKRLTKSSRKWLERVNLERKTCFVGIKRLANGGILLEMNNKEAAATIRGREVQKEFVK